MNALTRTLLISIALVAPVASFAQSTQGPVTRAEVRADLIRVEQAGYHPGVGDDSTYPADIQAAEAKIAAEDAAAAAGKNAVATTQAPMSGQMQAAVSMPKSTTPHYRIDDVRSPFYYGA
ncbi:protein of unknown function [Cupriavidus sp. YR651]|uniref:DUF4148 domain-containing protein n=1 Tax=Cupriavidus sp. YR651 TaxID=1855315 RepID=UPI0008893C4B|nr:DUF4148 domain-containing protein [Cupriavidus sp. YR651]SDD53037.1 protein of unknown function [Cupriavidus sp. YR651]